MAGRERQDGREAWLFPKLETGPQGRRSESWVKWWSRYSRSHGLTDPNKTFHSFRHGFKDALRAARVGEDVNDALTGHSLGSVGRSYGRKDMARRFTIPVLAGAIAAIRYEGLNLLHLYSSGQRVFGEV